MHDVIGCEDVCGDYANSCKMNNKQCVTVSCRVIICKVREEVDSEDGFRTGCRNVSC